MIRCPYCKGLAMLASGARVYPHREDLAHLRFWVCEPCGAWVGCHRDTMRPLGRLADAKLRRAKMDAHAAFDPLWRGGRMSRGEAYRRLGKMMGLTIKQCHIGEFDVEQCAAVVRIVESGALENERYRRGE